MEGDPNSLRTLEWYVKELFSGNSNNEQIQKIHKSLESFSCQKGAWRNSLYFLNQTNQYQTAMFSLTVLEGFITKGWHGLSSEEQIELRTTLYHWILENHSTSPYFIRNKVFFFLSSSFDASSMSNFSFTQYLLFQAIQLVVHIARCDWPDKYPDFYSNILSLVSSPSPSTTVVGLLFLQTASEELGTPRDDVLSSRKTELKQRLLHFVPQTLSVLTGIKLLSDLYCVQNGCLNFVAPHRFT